MPITGKTPIQAGWATVVDTSGIAQVAAQQKQKRAKKLQDMLVEYDTKGIFPRDIPEVQRQITDVQNYAMTNAEKIANPSQNMETWREFQAMQSKVKNLVTYSITAKEEHDKGNRMYHTDSGRYMTDSNAQVLEDYAATPTPEQYADLSAFRDLSKDFDRNVKLRPKEYTKMLEDALIDMPPEVVPGKFVDGKVITKEGKYLDREGSEDVLRPLWDAKSVESSDLKYTHGDSEEGFQKWVDEVQASVNVSPEYGTTTVKTETEKKSDLDKAAAADAFMKIRSGSGSTLTESPYEFKGGEQTGKGTKRDPVTATGRGKASDGNFYTRETLQDENQRRAAAAKEAGEKAPAPLTFDVRQVTSADAAIQTYGPATVGDNTVSVLNAVVKKPMGAATNLTSGEFEEEGKLRFKEGQIVREIGVYKAAKNTMTIRVKSGGKTTKIKIEAGQTLPNYTKMYEDGIIDSFTKSKLIANSKEFEGAVVMSIPETMNFFQLAPGDARNEGIQNIINSGKESYVVPLEDVSVEVDQFGQAKYKSDYIPIADKMAELRGMSTMEQKRRSNMPE